MWIDADSIMREVIPHITNIKALRKIEQAFEREKSRCQSLPVNLQDDMLDKVHASDLNLSTRAFNAISRELKWNPTVREIIEHQYSIQDYRNLGKKTLVEIGTVLYARGIDRELLNGFFSDKHGSMYCTICGSKLKGE